MDINSFDQILYINLAHRTDRKERLLSELDKIGTDPGKIYRIEAHYDPLNGHRGCALSHLKAVELAQKNGWECTLILEDDFVFTVSKEEVNAYFTHFYDLNLPWDVLMLGANVADYEKIEASSEFIRILSAQTAHGYAIAKHYTSNLKASLLFAIEKMKDDLFFFESESNLHILDHIWKALQISGKWYMGRRSVGEQGASFSDINHVYMKRHTPLEYLT